MKSPKHLILFTLFLPLWTIAQQTYSLTGGSAAPECVQCRTLIETKPKEVLFGIAFRNGNVYFEMSSEAWFRKIFSRSTDGITADIVLKEQFSCGKETIRREGWHTGQLLPPVYLGELNKRLEKEEGGHISILLGKIPAAMEGKEMEGNLVVLRDKKVCFYTNFTNIPRSMWDLLDMGLFTESLLHTADIPLDSEYVQRIPFTEKMTKIVPFPKGRSTFEPETFRKLYDILQQKKQRISRLEVRAFSSIEGATALNMQLQKERGAGIVKMLDALQTENFTSQVTSGENWMEFFQSIAGTPFQYLATLPKEDIKIRLRNKSLLDSIEPVLAHSRKAIVTFYLDDKNPADAIKDGELVTRLEAAVAARNIQLALDIQRSIYKRVTDNKIPASYLDAVTIPREKAFSRLLNDKNVYKLLLEEIYEDDALNELLAIEKTDPANGKIKYNICALQLRLLQYGDTLINRNTLLARLNQLPSSGTDQKLMRRMMINYHILLCEIYMSQGSFDKKDEALQTIRDKYLDLSVSDEDLLSIAKFFCYYAQYEWAFTLIEPRISRLEVNEDLLFYYLSLSIIFELDTRYPLFTRTMQNAIGINNARFCALFNAIDRGGISMQLLLLPFWKNIYCESCMMKTM